MRAGDDRVGAIAENDRDGAFNHVFDVVVVGSGYAGYAATMGLRDVGLDVMLMGPRGDLVWESGRSFGAYSGRVDAAAWWRFRSQVEMRGGAADDWLDGAICEVVATAELTRVGAGVLYYAQPVSIEKDGDAVVATIVATKGGLRRVAARAWIDATETGELLRLIDRRLPTVRPSRSEGFLMLQHSDWSRVATSEGLLRSTAWPGERVMAVDVVHDDPWWKRRYLSALDGLERAIGPAIAEISVSHLSFEPLSQYEAFGSTIHPSASNVEAAVPGYSPQSVVSLADRFALGLRAAEASFGLGHEMEWDDLLSAAVRPPEPTRVVTTEVCVAGIGTGGVFAALAASRAGGDVLAVDLQTFPGGIGTAGGVHGYWFGVAGGMQQEVDRRTRDLMKRFQGGPLGDGPFNPWAKMIVLEELLSDSAVNLLTGALVYDVETEDGVVLAALVATGSGTVRVEAATYVDGTGDGDICARAGAAFRFGREFDALPHAYTQSAGVLEQRNGRPRMGMVNFDAGFCDPSDPVDLSRARMVGVRQHLSDAYTYWTRPTYIAPVLGLRQSRQIDTEYVLSLDDQIAGRRFDDRIGYTGAHHDNHATDLQFESDEAVFWSWLNRQHTRLVVCEIPYRAIVPHGLRNVWIASRCLGVTQDAHYVSRMQRDMQRIGEAAGYAAAICAREGIASLDLSYARLRELLDASGALDRGSSRIDRRFGSYAWGGEGVPTDVERKVRRDVRAHALAALDQGQPGDAIWWLYQNEADVRQEVVGRLDAAGDLDPMVSWLAAGVAAMWSAPEAEPRLIRAIRTGEYGFGDGYSHSPTGQHVKTSVTEPLSGFAAPFVPNWLCALALLRRCGTRTCLPVLQEFMLSRSKHSFDTVSTVAITLCRLVSSRRVSTQPDYQAVARILATIGRTTVVGAEDWVGFPARSTGWGSEYVHRGDFEGLALERKRTEELLGPSGRNATHDRSWQMRLAVRRVSMALEEIHETDQ